MPLGCSGSGFFVSVINNKKKRYAMNNEKKIPLPFRGSSAIEHKGLP